MTEQEKTIERYLLRIAENLDITNTMRDKAVKSYQAVGKWLGDCDTDSSIKIMPQGSFYLGTIIKPVSDKEEYDIDLICLMKDAKSYKLADIKNTVGDRLKENSTYKKMLEPEGKRCWTLQYDEFHMDILPCVPNDTAYFEPYLTELMLTHKISEGMYIPKYSDPFKYHEWFEKRMVFRAYEIRKEICAKKEVEIDKVPTYSLKTPLQRAIQLLKRHRDIMYSSLTEEEQKNAPISIIITTLAAHAYNNEVNIYEALKNIIEKMPDYIKRKDGKYYILNPVMEEENFADKWNEVPAKAHEFFRWIKCVREDLFEGITETRGLHILSERLQNCFGENIVSRAFSDEGEELRSARESKSLFVNGLAGGIATTSSASSKRVGNHTFYGK